MRAEYDERRKFLLESLRDMGFDCFEPKGAFYVSLQSKNRPFFREFAQKLLWEGKVAVVPGSSFGENGQDFVRLAYATSMENLQEAVKRISTFLSNL